MTNKTSVVVAKLCSIAAERKELIAAVRQTARGLVDEQDPYRIAAVICVGHRLTHAETYGWDATSRARAARSIDDIVTEAERLDLACGEYLAEVRF